MDGRDRATLDDQDERLTLDVNELRSVAWSNNLATSFGRCAGTWEVVLVFPDLQVVLEPAVEDLF